MSAFSTYHFLYILAIPSVESVRNRSSISLVIILTLGSRSKTPVGFWHFWCFVTSLGCVYYTTCYTDIGIGELVIHLLCGMDPLCIFHGHDLLYFYHGSALYILVAMFTLSMGMPASGYLLGYDLLTFATGVPSVSAGLPSPLLHQWYLVIHFGHQHLFWSHALGGICYSWDSHQSYIWWY